jgi:hypothetical protein
MEQGMFHKCQKCRRKARRTAGSAPSSGRLRQCGPGRPRGGVAASSPMCSPGSNAGLPDALDRDLNPVGVAARRAAGEAESLRRLGRKLNRSKPWMHQGTHCRGHLRVTREGRGGKLSLLAPGIWEGYAGRGGTWSGRSVESTAWFSESTAWFSMQRCQVQGSG